MVKTLAIALALASAFSAAGVADAAGPRAPSRDAGRADFDRAVRYYRAKEYEAALPHFQAAYEKSGHRPSTIRALAQCERALKMYDPAIAHFREFLATDPKETDARQVRETIALLEELKSDRSLIQDAQQKPDTSSAPKDETPPIGPIPKRSEEVQTSTPAPSRRGPEKDVIERVEEPQPDEERREEILIPQVDTSREGVPLPGSPMSSTVQVEHHSKVLPILILGTGAAVAITGGVLVAVGHSETNKLENAPPGSMFQGELADAASRGPVLENVGLTLLAGGLVTAGAGLIWALAGGD